MEYALIWIESLACALVLVAFVMAWSARWPLLPAFALAVLALGLSYAAFWFSTRKRENEEAFAFYMLIFAICFAASAAMLACQHYWPATSARYFVRIALLPRWRLLLAVLALCLLTGIGAQLATAFFLAWLLYGARGQLVLPLGLAILLALLAASVTYALGWAQFSKGLEWHWFSYALAWTLCFIAATVVLFRRGWRRNGEGIPHFRTWPAAQFALALAALVLITWTTFSNMDLAVKTQLASVRAEAGAKMLAMTPPRVPDRDNAALIYQKAIASIKASRLKLPKRLLDKEQEMQEIWFAFDPAKCDYLDKDLADYLAGFQQGLALSRRAAAMPECSFERDYFLGAEMQLSEIQELRMNTHLLGLDALHRAAEGNRQRASEDVAAMFGIARHINDPFLIALLVQAAFEKIAVKSLERCMALTAWQPEDLARVTLEDKISFQRTFLRDCKVEEAVFGLPLLATLDSDTLSALPDYRPWLERNLPLALFRQHFHLRFLDTPVYRVFFLADDLAGYRRGMKRMQALAERPYYESAEQRAAYHESLRSQPPGIVAALLLPAADHFALAAAEADAAHGIARLAVASASYRLKHGKYPVKLDDLVPDDLPSIPIDPFDGQPLRLKHDGKAALLYSVGPDLKDDNGGMAWDVQKKQGDIVFHLPAR